MNLSQFADKPGGRSPLEQLITEFNRDDALAKTGRPSAPPNRPLLLHERRDLLSLQGGSPAVAPLLRYMPSAIPQDTLVALWGFQNKHLPDVHRKPWIEHVPTNAEARMMMAEIPAPMREKIPLPKKFRQLSPLAKLHIAARATLETIEKHRPIYHRSKCGRRLLIAEGTTIIVTDRDYEGGFGVEGVPWSYGESFKVVAKRMKERRQQGAPVLSPSQLALITGYLPVWQAVVSIVPQDEPETPLFGSSDVCPTVLAVGQKKVCFTSQHQIFRPDHGKLFTDTWFSVLDSLCFK